MATAAKLVLATNNVLSLSQLEHLFLEREDLRSVFSYLRTLYTTASIAVARRGDPKLDSIYRPRLVITAGRHNVVLYTNYYYVVPHALGSLDLESEQDRGRLGVLEFAVLHDALAYIQLCERQGIEFSFPLEMNVPHLMFQGRGYNVVHHCGRLYVVPQSLGPVDLGTESGRCTASIAQFDSLAEAVIFYVTKTTNQPPSLFNYIRIKCTA